MANLIERTFLVVALEENDDAYITVGATLYEVFKTVYMTDFVKSYTKKLETCTPPIDMSSFTVCAHSMGSTLTFDVRLQGDDNDHVTIHPSGTKVGVRLPDRMLQLL